MADLEELGFIEKTHSSSGRVPSEKGYRFYVDHLLAPQNLPNAEIVQIKDLFAERILKRKNCTTICSNFIRTYELYGHCSWTEVKYK